MRRYSFCIISLFIILLANLSSPSSRGEGASNIVGSWSADTNLPYLLAGHSSQKFNIKLFVITGSAQTFNSHNEVVYSIPDLSGSLSPWSYITDYPYPMIWNSGTNTENHLYVLGGFEEYSGSNKFSDNYVYYSQGGATDPWVSTSPLPQRLSKGAAVVVGDYIYFIGGWTDVESAGNASRKVYYALINPDGSVGVWNTTSDLPDVWWDHRAVEYAGYIYVIGGWNSSGVTNQVLRAKTNADGTLSGWSNMPNLPSSVRAAGITRAGNLVFIVGGFDGGNFLNTVYYTTLDANGNMSAWEGEDNLPFSHCCGALAEVGGYLYLTGGYSGGYTDKVYRAQVTALPSPTPTPSATPLPNLNIPDLKQYSPPWNDDQYDQATSWSDNPTIERWGCALTSAAMVLQYHGHNVNPDTLNAWLKSQTDGYLRNGLLNWLAVSRYTRLHDSPTSPTLEYRRLGNTQTDLIAELTAGRPAILAEPGHFIVARSQTAGSFGINDPAYTTKPTLTSYGNTFANLGSYRPTHSNLSYIMLVADAGINISAFDSTHSPVGQTSLEQPLIDDIGNTATSGIPLKVFLLPVPLTGNYTVELTGPAGAYQLDAYLYNQLGDVVKSAYRGLIAPSETDIVVVNIGPNSKTMPQVTIDSLLIDLEDANNAGKISRPQIYRALKTTLLSAKLLIQKGLSNSTKKVLNSTLVTLKTSTPRFIGLATSQILQENTQLLINKL